MLYYWVVKKTKNNFQEEKKMELFLIIAVLVIGLLMAIAPKLMVKKDKRDDASAVKKLRIVGIILSIIAALVAVVFVLM